jgi:hypothetical protein
MIAVKVGEDHRVELGKITRLCGRFPAPLAPQAVAQRRPLPAVQEVGVGQQREAAQAQQRRGVADEGEVW